MWHTAQIDGDKYNYNDNTSSSTPTTPYSTLLTYEVLVVELAGGRSSRRARKVVGKILVPSHHAEYVWFSAPRFLINMTHVVTNGLIEQAQRTTEEVQQ